MNSRTNLVTKLAPNEVIKKDVPRLISLSVEQSQKLVRRTRHYVGDFVRIAKTDLHFRKGYKQSVTDEVFEIFDIPTRNPRNYNLIDADKKPIEGKFYEPEPIRVLEKERRIKLNCLTNLEAKKIHLPLHWCHQPHCIFSMTTL